MCDSKGKEITEPIAYIKEATKTGCAEVYEGDSINLEQLNSKTRRGRVSHQIAQTITTSPNQATIEATTTRRSDIASTIRATVYKQGERNIMKNIENGSGYEGIIELINAEPDGTCRPIKAQYAKTSTANFEYKSTYGATGVSCNYRIRKLTPTECWKLMGMTEEDIQKAEAVGVSNSQLYKQAGNGLVTNCISLIFEHLYKSQYDNGYECTDENFTQPQSD